MPLSPESPAPTEGKEAVPLTSLTARKSGALHPQDSVETAGKRMRENNAPAWPVTEDRKLVGMVDAKNPDWEIAGHGHDPKSCDVGSIMNRDVAFCYEDENCADAERVMNERGLAFLPVVDRQMRIVGIFTRQEIQNLSSTQPLEDRSPKT